MPLSRSVFAQRVTSRWSGYLPLWVIAIVVWCVNSTLLLGFAVQPQNLLFAGIANAVSAALLVVCAVLWGRLLAWITQHRVIPVWLVFLMGACVGAVKGLSTYSVFWTLTGTQYSFQALTQSTLPAIVTGLWLLPAFAIVGSIRSEYDAEREVLISEIVSRKLSEATSKYLDHDVAQFVVRARVQLDHARDSTDQFRTALTELAELDVRPMSHKMWEKEDARIEKYGFRDLATTTITQHLFPASWISIALFVSLLFLQIPLVGPTDAFQRSLFQSLAALVILSLGRVIPLRGKLSGPVVFFVTPLVVVIVIEVATQYFAGPLPGVNGFVAETILYLSLVTSLLGLGATLTARGTHVDIREKLSALRNESMSADADKIIQLIRRRETAELLHGFVQNQLLSNAVKLSTAPDSLNEVKNNISRMLSELEQGEHTAERPLLRTIDELSQSISEVWRGVMNVRITSHVMGEPTGQELLMLDRVMNELAANAHRHGLATEISIDIEGSAPTFTLTADDNGKGLSAGPPGLGTALLASLSRGNWSREQLSTGGTRVRCILSH